MSSDHQPTLTSITARTHLDDAIARVAPDVTGELESLPTDLDLFEEFGLDSMDRLTIMETLATTTGVAIPEEDYPRLTTVDAIVAHLLTDAWRET